MNLLRTAALFPWESTPPRAEHVSRTFTMGTQKGIQLDSLPK